MRITEFIKDKIFQPRLKEQSCLVVYDKARRYHELCLSMASDKYQVVDASESSIESRLAALKVLSSLGQAQAKIIGLLVYVPANKPITDEEKQADPFALYGACGAIFPQDDGDEFINICLRAKPEHKLDIRRVFERTPAPTFEVIDAIGKGTNWPELRATLKAESTKDILIALLAPEDEQRKAMKGQDGWRLEAKELLLTVLGLELKTKAKGWDALADELWRYLLFSEFVFDLPGELPAELKTVPHAPKKDQETVYDICEQLRNHLNKRSRYMEQAENVEKTLNLATLCSQIKDLGQKDTFLFEERALLRSAIDSIIKNNKEHTRKILNERKNSVWRSKGESRAEWDLVRNALNLIEACEETEHKLPNYAQSQESLLDFYITNMQQVDRLQREFETLGISNSSEEVEAIVKPVQTRYCRLTGKVQQAFIRHLETTGWPPVGRLANVDVYDRFVGEKLKERGNKIAYLMIDALRYELGVELEKLLSGSFSVELQPAYAQMPTITPVGMASLLPGARTELFLDYINDSLVPKLAGEIVTNVPQRMEAFRKQLGDRFMEMRLQDFLNADKKFRLSPTVDLVVLRNNDIDEQLEKNLTSLNLISQILKQIHKALRKLQTMGFNEAIIVTDHGFFLNTYTEPGDVCAKPPGNWQVKTHERMLLGIGSADSNNFVLPAEKLGIRGAFAQAAGPRTMSPYSAGYRYFHGGASLVESVVPVLIVKLEAAPQIESQKLKVALSYKAKKITTRLPMIKIMLHIEEMPLLSVEIEKDILLEAYDDKGQVVGEPQPGGEVNVTTRLITLKEGELKSIMIKMNEDFEGKFTLKALNPDTLAVYGSLNLETDYTI